MDLPEITKLGTKKYFEDCGRYRNPYPSGSAEFNEFERGWMQSLKRDNGCLASQHNHEFIGHGKGFPEMPKEPLSALAIDAERYRSRKG